MIFSYKQTVNIFVLMLKDFCYNKKKILIYVNHNTKFIKPLMATGMFF